MKRNIVIVVVFAVVVAVASFAKAEEVEISFDGGSNQVASLDGLKRVLPDFKAAFPVPAAPSDVAQSIPVAPANASQSDTLHKLDGVGLQRLRKEILSIPRLSEEFFQLINNEKTIVLYNNNNVFLVSSVGENTYVMLLESDDKRLIEFLATGVQNKHWITTCAKHASTIWKWISGVWTAADIITTICRQEWVSPSDDSAGSGTTWHPGMGGDSNYDVNRLYVK